MKVLEKLIKAVFLMVFISAFLLPRQIHAETRSLWQKRQKNIQNNTSTQKPIRKTFQRLIDPLKIKIPEEYGTIIKTHRGSNGKLIIHIQDAHANFEGQMSLANILETLIIDYDLNLILVEGGSTDSDFTYLRDRAPLEERREKAEKLLKDGIIAGEDYLNIASDYPMSFQGIEDRSLYNKNVDALWEIDKFKGVGLEYIERLVSISDILKKHIYNKELLELDKAKKQYKAEKIDLISYYHILYSAAEKEGFPMSYFPNFQNIIKANELEKKLDLAKIKEGKATDIELKLYRDYTEISKDLNVNELFKEEPLLENSLKESLASTPDERRLIEISRALSTMKNLLKVKVVPEEYDHFIKNKEEFVPQEWTQFLKEKSDSHKLSLKIPRNHHIITDNIEKIEYFYTVAEERNNVFLRKTEERLEKDNITTAALIAGGFHTPMLTDLLAKNGYSYIVISPKLTEQTDEDFYRSTLRRQWLPER